MKSETDEKPAVLLGGPPFDHQTYQAGIDQAKLLLHDAIQTYWAKCVKSDPYYKLVKPAAVALFEEENYGCNPDDLVQVGDPLMLPGGKGTFCRLYTEIAPAWTLYAKRAGNLLFLLGRLPPL